VLLGRAEALLTGDTCRHPAHRVDPSPTLVLQADADLNSRRQGQEPDAGSPTPYGVHGVRDSIHLATERFSGV
jgi:hypothetical protein